MDGLEQPLVLSNDDIAKVVGSLTLDNVSLRNEIARLQKIISDAQPKELVTE